MLLAGDIGGTKTVLALYRPEDGPRVSVAERTYPSAGSLGLAEIVHRFLRETGASVETAVFGVAGPVVDRHVTGTNLPWELDEVGLEGELGLRSVRLINDLVALSYGVLVLEDQDLLTLNDAPAVPGGTMGVIAPGTGLGEGFLVWDGARYRAYPSEGGHSDFAPGDELQVGLLSYLYRELDHVSWERVCSGVGIPNIYGYLRASGREEEPEWLSERLAGASDPTPIIVEAALQEDPACPICRATLDVFVAILGAETGNMGLRLMATGGVYIGGGIPPRILSYLRGATFQRAFRRKGRLSYVMEAIPVRVILNQQVALLGAAAYGLGVV